MNIICSIGSYLCNLHLCILGASVYLGREGPSPNEHCGRCKSGAQRLPRLVRTLHKDPHKVFHCKLGIRPNSSETRTMCVSLESNSEPLGGKSNPIINWAMPWRGVYKIILWCKICFWMKGTTFIMHFEPLCPPLHEKTSMGKLHNPESIYMRSSPVQCHTRYNSST